MELIVALLIVAVLTVSAIPLFRSIVARNRLAVATNHLLGGMTLARQLAVTQGLPTTFCAGNVEQGCHGDWSAREWLVFTDRGHDGQINGSDKLHSAGSLGDFGNIVLLGNGPFRTAVLFAPTGVAETISGAFAAGRIRVCALGLSSLNANELVLAATGRVRLEQTDASEECSAL